MIYYYMNRMNEVAELTAGVCMSVGESSFSDLVKETVKLVWHGLLMEEQ